MRTLNAIVWFLLIVGGLNLGSMGLFNYDFVTGLFGVGAAGVIFALIGLAALYGIFLLRPLLGSRGGTIERMPLGGEPRPAMRDTDRPL